MRQNLRVFVKCEVYAAVQLRPVKTVDTKNEDMLISRKVSDFCGLTHWFQVAFFGRFFTISPQKEGFRSTNFFEETI